MATSNLNLITSSPGVDTDLDAATREQTNIGLLDLHDHTSGKGVKIPSGGININADLPMASNSLIGLKSNQFNSQSSALATTNTLYVKNGELFYIDNAGNSVQITSSGAVSVSSLSSGSVVLDGGNSRGSNLRVGTNDAYSMILETSNTDRFSIDSDGLAKFIYDFAVQKGSANASTGTLNDVSTSQKSYFQFTGAGAVTVTGFANGSDGKVILLTNKTGSQLTINNNDSGSSAANRILTGTGSSLSVENNASIMAVYDSTNSLWNVVGGTGGSSGGKPIYSIDLSSGSLYNDSASAPVDGTGGVTTGMTYASVTSGTLRGAVSYKLSKDAANRQGCGVAYSLTIDTVDKSSTQSIQFDVSASANFASGDMALYVYDVTNSTMLPMVSLLPTGIQGQFSRAINLTTGTSYRIILHVASTSALAYDVTVDTMTVDSIIRPQVAGISDVRSYTTTFSAGLGGGTATFYYKREGDSLVLMPVKFTIGTPAASLASFTLPTGLTIDTSKITAAASAGVSLVVVGVGYRNNSGSTQNALTILADTTSTNSLFISGGSTSGVNPINATTATTIIATGDIISISQIKIPITQWSSNITLASSNGAIEYVSNSSSTDADDTTSFVPGAQGSAGPIGTTALTAARKKRIQFSTPVQLTDRLQIELYDSTITGAQWVSIGNGAVFNRSAANRAIMPIFYGNAVLYGMALVPVSSTQYDVVFGAYPNINNTTLGSAGDAWTTFTNVKWRVAKYSAIGAAELAPATELSQGTVAYSQWTSYTPTFTGAGTVTSISAKYRREGDSMRVKGTYTTGLSSATLASISLPSPYVIDTTKMFTNSTTASPGETIGRNMRGFTAAGAGFKTGLIVACTSTSTSVVYLGTNEGQAVSPFIPQNGNGVYFTTSELEQFEFLIPILGWS